MDKNISKGRVVREIHKFLKNADWAFQLNNFTRGIVVVKDQPEGQPNLAAEVIPDMVYQEITIKVYPNFFKLDPRDQAAALVHELVHTALQKSKTAALDLISGNLYTIAEINNINETATSHLSHIIFELAGGRLRYFSRAVKEYIKNLT